MKMADVATFDNLEDLAEMAEGLATFVRQAAADGTSAHVAEKEILQRILAMGRQAMGQFLRMQGEGDVGETIEMPDGETVRRLDEPHRRTYRSIFGLFALSRYVYGTRVGQRIDFVPLDARLELSESEYSYFRLLTRICGGILVRVGVRGCGIGRFQSLRRCGSRMIFSW